MSKYNNHIKINSEYSKQIHDNLISLKFSFC